MVPVKDINYRGKADLMHLENHLKSPKNVGVKTYLSPDGYISIDKTIYHKRSRTSVKTYN